MNKNELNNALAFINNPQGELQLIIYARIEDNPVPKKLDVKADDLTGIRQLFVNGINDSVINKNEHTVLLLSAADDRGKCFYQYDLEVPQELKDLESVVGNDNLETFSFENDLLANIHSLIIVLADNQNEATLYKKLSPVEVIGRGGYIFWKANQRLERFDNQLLRITPKFQVLRVQNEIIITDLATIERSFGFHDVITREAIASLELINNLQLVANIDSLQELVHNVSFARKLTKVAKNSPVIKLEIPVEQIIAFAKTHPLTKKKMKYNDNGTQFNLTTKVSKNLLIKILNDDLLTSELTKLYYDSLAKDDIEVETAEISSSIDD
jgi:hypothetical protein